MNQRARARSKAAAAGLVLLTLGLGACGQSPTKPNILVVLIDTLRADRLGCYGNRKGLTPFLDRFAGSATVFRHAYATSSWTAPSVASLFTSRYPSQHRVVSVASKMSDRETTLAEVLTEHGYRTGAVVANDVVAARLGYDHGFSSFRNVPPSAPPVIDRGLEWLDATRASEPAAPVLLYLHFMDTHWPYTPRQEYVDRFVKPHFDAAGALAAMTHKIGQAFNEQYVSGRTDVHRTFTCEEIGLLESLYNAEVAELDGQLERLFAALQQRHFLDDALIVITSDHGEEFFEHGGLWHAYTLYEESLRVPLIVRVPGQRSGGVVDEMVSLLDVAPSILRGIGVERPASFLGTSFVHRLGGSWLPPLNSFAHWWDERSPLFAELEGESPRQPQLRMHAATLIADRRKLLVRSRGEAELYDLGADPLEEHDLSASERALRTDLSTRLRAVQTSMGDAGGASESVKLDEATHERLKALGYGLADSPPPEGDPHPITAAHVSPPAPNRRQLCAPPLPSLRPPLAGPGTALSFF